MKNVLYLFLLIALFGCKSAQEGAALAWIAPEDSIVVKLKVDDFFASIAFSDSSGELPNIYCLNYRQDSIFKIDKSGNAAFVTAVPKEVRSDKFRFGMANDSPTYALMQDCKLVSRGRTITLKTEEKKFSYLFLSNSLPIVANTVLAQKLPYLRMVVPEERKKLFSSKVFALLKITSSDTCEEHCFLDYPKEYRGDDIYTDFLPHYARVSDSLVYYLFSCSDSLGCYNMKTDRLQTIAISGYKGCEMVPDIVDSVPSLSYSKRKALATEQVLELLHDPYSERFCVVKAMPLDLKATNTSMYLPTFEDLERHFTFIKGSKVEKILRPKNYKSIWVANSFFWRNKLYIWNYKHTKIYIYKV